MTIGRIEKLENDINEHLEDLPDSPDHILIILKGHLLVEQEINRLLEAKLPNPDVLKLKKANGPKFFHKVCLLEALIPNPKNVSDLWDLIKKLNELRNELSHKLYPIDINRKIDEFVIKVFESMDSQLSDKVLVPSSNRNRRMRIRASLSVVLSYLVEMREIEMSM